VVRGLVRDKKMKMHGKLVSPWRVQAKAGEGESQTGTGGKYTGTHGNVAKNRAGCGKRVKQKSGRTA